MWPWSGAIFGSRVIIWTNLGGGGGGGGMVEQALGLVVSDKNIFKVFVLKIFFLACVT